MKYLILINLILLTLGCSNHITSEHIQKAENLCLNNEGLNRISSGDSTVWFYCNNGAMFSIDK